MPQGARTPHIRAVPVVESNKGRGCPAQGIGVEKNRKGQTRRGKSVKVKQGVGRDERGVRECKMLNEAWGVPERWRGKAVFCSPEILGQKSHAEKEHSYGEIVCDSGKIDVQTWSALTGAMVAV